ncbi:MAG: hypothetical protein JO022_16450, partial [Acidobacteriaceae bacterium]|nr:hypothetical protein [Acidobacteriaceae bacterium]
MIFAFAAAASGAVTADLSRYTQSKDFIVAQSGNLLTIDSRGEKQTRLRIVFNLADPERLIHEVSVAPRADASRAIILEDAAPAYRVYTGRRHGSWEDNYFDNPSTRPHEVVEYMGQLALKRCRVEETGGRLQVILGELRLGIFHGDVVFTLYAGSNLVKQEAVVSTEEASVAYYYDSWVTRCSTNALSSW